MLIIYSWYNFLISGKVITIVHLCWSYTTAGFFEQVHLRKRKSILFSRNSFRNNQGSKLFPNLIKLNCLYINLLVYLKNSKQFLILCQKPCKVPNIFLYFHRHFPTGNFKFYRSSWKSSHKCCRYFMYVSGLYELKEGLT